MKMFKSWSFNMVKNLYLNTIEQEFKKNIFVYKEGDRAGDVYLIKSGEFRVCLRFHLLNKSLCLGLDFEGD